MVALRAFEACKIGDIETLKKLPDVVETLVDSNGASFLHYAARGGSLVVVEYLVKSLNFSVLARTNTGATALHDAAAKGNTAIVKWLVERGDVDVNDQDGAGVTALHLAARYRHFLTVEWLLDEATADASVRSSAGALPLHFAVVGGDINCVKILVDENPRLVNMQMNNGAAPVYLASQAGHLEILEHLISRNGATKVKAYDAMSCLHAAAQMGHLDVVKWLVTVDKCNPNDRDFDGSTPLHFAASRGHADIVRWLLKEGGARVTLDNLGGSPLHSAAELGELQSVQALLDCGCDVNLTDNCELTAAELADKCEQAQAAALIRGQITLAQLKSSPHQNDQSQHLHSPDLSFPPPPHIPPEDLQAITKTASPRTSYSPPSASPPLPPPPPPPPPPAQSRSVSSTPSTVGSPITPPTPIHEDEVDPVAVLGYGHGSVNQASRGVYRDRPPIKRTFSRTSVDSSASNFGVFEQQDAGVIHKVTAEVHKTPKVVPPTPRPVSAPVVPGHGSLNSTQESIIFSTSSSSFSQDESSPGPVRKIVQKTTRIPSGLSDHSHQNPSSPPLAHSTLSAKRDSLKSNISTYANKTQADSEYSNNGGSHPAPTSQDTDQEPNKFQYYSTPYKNDFNTVTRSSFAKVKALFQYNQVNSPQVCPDSGEICTKSEREYSLLNQVSSASQMDAHAYPKPKENIVVSPDISSAVPSSHSSHNSLNQNAMKSVITIQGSHTTILTTGSKPDADEGHTARASALSFTPEQREASSSTVQTDNGSSSIQIQKGNLLQELKSKALSQVTSSTYSADPALANGHVKSSATHSNHIVGSSGTRVTPLPSSLAVNGNTAHMDNRSTNSKNLSRSSSESSTSSQTFSPVESKHNLIADIQSAVSGASNLSLKRAKSRGEGVSMVYQSKKGGAGQAEVKADNTPLTGQFDPKNFIDSVEKVDSTGRVIPEWRRQVLAKHLAEKAHKEFNEKKSAEDYEAKFKDMPGWKRALIERKGAQAREETASNKK